MFDSLQHLNKHILSQIPILLVLFDLYFEGKYQ